MGYVISLGKEIVRKRKMILDLSKADFRKRFVGSYFGIVWMFLQPLVTVLIYWFIFGEYGMKSVPPVPNASYVVWLVPGLVPWFFLQRGDERHHRLSAGVQLPGQKGGLPGGDSANH